MDFSQMMWEIKKYTDDNWSYPMSLYLRKPELWFESNKYWGFFGSFCRRLSKRCNYKPILEFMIHVFSNAEEYDLNKFARILEGIKVTKAVTLRDLCVTYYNAYTHNIEQGIEEDPFKLEHSRINSVKTREFAGISFYVIAKAFGCNIEPPSIPLDEGILIDFEFTYGAQGMTIDTENCTDIFIFDYYYIPITIEIIDQIVSNAKKIYGESYGEKIPGLLIPAINVALAQNEFDIILYILDKHVNDKFMSVSWFSDRESDTYIMGFIYGEYMQFTDYMISASHFYYNKNYLPLDTSAKSYSNDLLTKKIIFLDKEEPFGNALISLSYRIADIIHFAQPILIKVMNSDSYSNLIHFVACTLYASGNTEFTSMFLIKYFSTIKPKHRRYFNMQAILVRCILESKNIYVVNTLYGYYSNELSLLESDYETNYSMLIQIVDFSQWILDEFQFLYDTRPNKSVFRERDLILDESYLFASTVRKCSVLLEKKENLSAFPLDDLATCMYAFRISGFIHLPLLNIPYNRDDKVMYPMIDDTIYLSEKAVACYNQIYNVLIPFTKCIILSKSRIAISNLINSHVSTLIDDNIDDYINQMSAIKKQLSQEDDPAKIHRLEREIDTCLEVYSEKYNAIITARPALINDLFSMMNSFKEKYDLHLFDNTVFNELYDIDNQYTKWIIQSELVYKTISRKEDAADYSSAVNPLSKVLESALNNTFANLTPDYDKITIQSVRNDYFKDGVIRKDLEFGQIINFFNDKNNYRLVNGELKWDKEPKDYYSCFDHWDGKKVFNIELLKTFKDIEMTCALPQNVVHCFSFNKDRVRNRNILYLALLYIKDYYRNPSAHKGKISRADYEKFRDIMLGKGSLLWVVLSIIKAEEKDDAIIRRSTDYVNER